MNFKPYARVTLKTDRFLSKGAKKGDIGFIIEVYPDGNYEVEFSDSTGITYAQLVAKPEDLQLYGPESGVG